MSELFCKRDKHDKILYEPFGGKITVFLGDAGQLTPVSGASIWDDDSPSSGGRGGSSRKMYKNTMYIKKTKRGQQLFCQHLLTHCILLNRGMRNTGILQAILDRVRNGTQTEDDLDKLVYQKRSGPTSRFNIQLQNSNMLSVSYNF
jgi:hypothetical protein